MEAAFECNAACYELKAIVEFKVVEGASEMLFVMLKFLAEAVATASAIRSVAPRPARRSLLRMRMWVLIGSCLSVPGTMERVGIV